MKLERAGDMLTGANFTTLLTQRRGTVEVARTFGDAVYVKFADGERKQVHKDVLFGVHWVN